MPENTDANPIHLELDSVGAEAARLATAAQSLEEIEKVRVDFLGKKGKLSEVLRGLGQVDAQERPAIGAKANSWKAKIESAIEERRQTLQSAVLTQQLAREKIDVTLPPRMPRLGGLHPVTQTMDRVLDIFGRIGFSVTSGPEVETEYMNFEAVNIPADHPARDMQDTFFVEPGVLLRTHTTPVQMRTMLKQPWPLRILCPGAVYRCDQDATHSPMFHQIEGLWVDRGVRMSDLKGVLEYFAQELFGKDVVIRLRPSYFSFVEPGVEVDCTCFQCGKNPRPGCTICRGTGWLEILGAGMVHPHLFKEAGYKDGATGFAFGIGIDRLAMLLHHIPDLRWLFKGDLRFLEQFS